MKTINAWAAHHKGDVLRPWSYQAPALDSQEVIVRVLACGICHSDLHAINDDWGMSNYPLVPGHEVVGIVEDIGHEVSHLSPGDRVGVGWLQSACLHCSDCYAGNENLCDDESSLIFDGYGGFASHVVVDSRFAFPIPEAIDTRHAGPLLCGGVTVYSGLRQAGMKGGQRIGIIGIGGLGHLAVQFASMLGNEVTVFTTSEDKMEFARQLGAHHAVMLGEDGSPPRMNQRFDIILSTPPVSLPWARYLSLLASDGVLNLVGPPPEPLEIPVFALMTRRGRLMSSPTGGRGAIEETLAIAARFGVEPIIETFPFDHIQTALERVENGEIRYRAVLIAEAMDE